jgi:peptidyl-prolyl cis-trans isomerase SurA
MTRSRFLTRVATLSAAAVSALVFAQGPTPAPAQPRGQAPRTAPSTAPRSASLDRNVLLDRVVAIVNDEAVTQYDLDEQKKNVLTQMKSQNVTPPAADVLDKQLLDRLITERAVVQFAKENGVRVDDTQVERTIARIAQENKMTPEEFRRALEKEGVPYDKYREDIRKEMVIQRLRDREVDSHISVSDSEVEAFLASQVTQSGGSDVEYRLSHVLVIVPERATPEQIEAKRRRAEDALKQIRDGTDFAQVAAGFSDAPDALQGGSLGWRAAARLPTIFAEPVKEMKPGDVSKVLRSATGFHIVKLQELRSRNAPTVVEQTRARHILIKVSEIVSDAEAKARIDRVRDRIETGAKFEDQAKLNSEDATSAKGGDLGWLSPGDTVPEFEATMNKLKIGEISAPVRSQFGWHLIQVSERRTQDITAERRRDQARMSLRQRKSDEAFQDWLRQMRDQAYVEIKPLEQ